MATAEMVGQGIAGALIAANTLKVLVEKDLITASDVATIFGRSIAAVSQPVTTEENAAMQILTDLQTQLFPSG
jgi:selenophosphate synthetase-related protein